MRSYGVRSVRLQFRVSTALHTRLWENLRVFIFIVISPSRSYFFQRDRFRCRPLHRYTWRFPRGMRFPSVSCDISWLVWRPSSLPFGKGLSNLFLAYFPYWYAASFLTGADRLALDQHPVSKRAWLQFLCNAYIVYGAITVVFSLYEWPVEVSNPTTC